jgi:hypothetical protein
MPNTTNFNWPTPADTDLVKDGAAAIRNLGNGVDTSLVDLKGGTTGQILSKASNADMDFAFITPNVGDITEVQAGVGISVASGTGPIPVITNSSTDLITTAGDILYGTAADTVARLGIGTAGQVLKVNSGATAPEWGAASSTVTYSGVAVKKTAAQSINNATFTAITWDSEDFDIGSYHDNSTNNSRITIPSGKTGYFLLSGVISFAANATGNRGVELRKNGSGVDYIFFLAPAAVANAPAFPFSFTISLAAADYLELFAYQTSSGALNVDNASTKWQVSFLGA